MVAIVSGDEVGLLKLLSLRGKEEAKPATAEESSDDEPDNKTPARVSQSQVLATWGTQGREHQIDDICVLSSNRIAAALRSDVVEELKIEKPNLDRNHYSFNSKETIEFEESSERMVSLSLLSKTKFAKRVLVSCSENGSVQIAKTEKPLEEDDVELEFNVGGPVEVMTNCAGSSLIAVGGREKDLMIWDLNTQESVFEARNVPHDKLDMRVPVWITGIQFQKQEGPECQNEKVLFTSTGYGQVRVYDIRAQKRPVRSAQLKDFGHIKAMVGVSSTEVIVGDVQGHLARFDTTNMRTKGHFKGFAGGIRSLDLHPTQPLLVGGGLDRVVRVYNLQTRKLVSQLYVKQKLTSVKFCPKIDDQIVTAPKNKRVRMS